MNHSLAIYGSSDDLIEIEGDFTEEIGCYNFDEDLRLGLSDGTLLSVKYDDDGIWRFAPVTKGPQTDFSIVQAQKGDEDNYSDRVTLLNPRPFTWAVFGKTVTK